MSAKPQKVEFSREFPQSPDSEKGVLAAMLLSPVEVRAICSDRGVTKDSFYLPAHAELFEVMVGLLDANKPLEMLTLLTALRDKGLLETIPPAFVNELTIMLPSAAYISHHIDDLLGKAKLRKVIDICNLGQNEAYELGAVPDDLLHYLHGEIGKIIHQRSQRQSVKEILGELIEEVKNGKPEEGLIRIPFDGIGDRLRLYRGDYLTISAPTSCGKTAMAAQFALNAGLAGHRVAIYPLEMRQKSVIKRAIAQLGGSSIDYVRSMVIGPETQHALGIIDKFMSVVEWLRDMKLHVRDDVHDWPSIRADIRVEHAKAPFTFIMIDYLQLIQTEMAKGQSRQQQLGAVSKDIKRLAQELDCIICVPSQQNEDGNTREARDAENDSNSLIKIQGEPDENGDMRPGRVTVWKQREGERHVELPLQFNGNITRWERSEGK